MNNFIGTSIFTGAIALVIGGVFLWVKVTHKKRKRRYQYPMSPASTGTLKTTALASAEHKQKRRRRRSKPPTNPTLAQTRGLPPVREDHRAVAEHYQN